MSGTDDTSDLAAQLRESERGEAAPWLTYPDPPRWMPFALGAWAFAYALTVGLLDGRAQTLANAGLVALVVAMVVLDRRRRGTRPTGNPPCELARLIVVFVVLCIGFALAGWLVGASLGAWPSAALVGVAVTALTWWYGAAYERVAVRLRERLE